MSGTSAALGGSRAEEESRVRKVGTEREGASGGATKTSRLAEAVP